MEIHCGLEDDQALNQGLRDLGWSSCPDQNSWRHDTPHGPAQLVELSEPVHWRQFELRGGTIRRPTPSRLFAENFRLSGPLKFRVIGRQTACLADVPWGAGAWQGRDLPASYENPWLAWSQSITRLVCGGLPEAQSVPEIHLDAVLREIQFAGWSASIDDGRLLVHLQLPGAYRQLRIEMSEQGPCVVVDLVDWSGVSRPSLRAMQRVAQAVNARLPLVRLAIDERNQPTVLRAEVHLASVPILGAWITSAVEVVSTAVALMARELEALRDPELAQLVLAAPAA